MMNELIDISPALYDDEAVCFIADRYHTTPQKVVRCFLVQAGLISDMDAGAITFHLESNEIEILRGLTFIRHS